MVRDAMSVKIRFKNSDDCETAKYFIRRDRLSDRKYKPLGNDTLVVNSPTTLLLREIGLTFLTQDYSSDPIT